jgi:hypothetical protein
LLTLLSWEWVGHVGRRETPAQVVGVSLGSESAAGLSSGAAERQQERRPSVLCDGSSSRLPWERGPRRHEMLDKSTTIANAE